MGTGGTQLFVHLMTNQMLFVTGQFHSKQNNIQVKKQNKTLHWFLYFKALSSYQELERKHLQSVDAIS